VEIKTKNFFVILIFPFRSSLTINLATKLQNRHSIDTVIRHSITFQELISAKNSAFLKKNLVNLPSEDRGQRFESSQTLKIRQQAFALNQINQSLHQPHPSQPSARA
jgi:hypothetical protein